MVDAREEYGDLILVIDSDRSLAVLLVRSGKPVVDLRSCKAAGRALVLADVIVMVILVVHGLLADGAILAVIIDAFMDQCVTGKNACTEIDRAFPVLAEACDQRVIGIQDQRHVIVDGLADNALDPLGMSVAGHLVSIKIVNYKKLGMKKLECVSGISLVCFEENNVALYLALHSRIADKESRDTLDLIGAFFIVSDLKTVARKHMGDHLDGGCLAVRARDSYGKLRKLKVRQNIRADLEGKFAGQARAAPEKLRQASYDLANKDCCKHSYLHREAL